MYITEVVEVEEVLIDRVVPPQTVDDEYEERVGVVLVVKFEEDYELYFELDDEVEDTVDADEDEETEFFI